MNNWMMKAGYYDKVIKDISTLEVKNFNNYRIDKLEFNVRKFREYKPNDAEYKPIFITAKEKEPFFFLQKQKKYYNLINF